MAVRGVGEQTRTETIGSTRQETQTTGTRTTQQTNNEPIRAAVNNLPNIQTDLKRFDLNQRLNQSEPQTPPNRLGNLSEGDRIPVRVGAETTQTDVLRAGYTEFATRAGLDDPQAYAERMITSNGNQLLHPGNNAPFTAQEFENARRGGAVGFAVQSSDMTNLRQARIEELTSTSITDWFVTADEQRQAVGILQNDPNLSDTINRLESNGSLRTLIERVDDHDTRRDLIDTLGRNLNSQTAEIVRPHIENLDVQDRTIYHRGGPTQLTEVSDNLWQVRFNMARLGITATNNNFDPSSYGDLIGANNGAFSGVGATGINPTTVGVPLGSQFNLLMDDLNIGDQTTTNNYDNPLDGLDTYIASLSPQDRVRQAELLLNRSVSTSMPEVFGNNLPSRADVIRAAANRYNLQPEVVAAFILAEQRDQSQNEDAADYTAGTTVNRDTSIGLGQVVVSTAQRNRLFSDLISERTQAGMSHDQTATLLADDTANIFAVARYLRQTANAGATRAAADLPNTLRQFPNLNLSSYAQNSSQWTDDNIRVLGSEYTSRAWDDRLFMNWGNFVLEAYRDVQRSGVFTR